MSKYPNEVKTRLPDNEKKFIEATAALSGRSESAVMRDMLKEYIHWKMHEFMTPVSQTILANETVTPSRTR